MKIITTLNKSKNLIHYEKKSKIYKIKWGKTSFELPCACIKKILEDFFRDPNEYYFLGASMTNPIKGGMGEFIRDNYKIYTPRHASAIAAIMVNEGLIESKGKSPISLRKL